MQASFLYIAKRLILLPYQLQNLIFPFVSECLQCLPFQGSCLTILCSQRLVPSTEQRLSQNCCSFLIFPNFSTEFDILTFFKLSLLIYFLIHSLIKWCFLRLCYADSFSIHPSKSLAIFLAPALTSVLVVPKSLSLFVLSTIC